MSDKSALTLTKFEKDRVVNRAVGYFNEMREEMLAEGWKKIGIDDTVHRLISANYRAFGLDEKALRKLPDLTLMEVTGCRIIANGVGTLTGIKLKRPVKVSTLLITCVARAASQRYDTALSNVVQGTTSDLTLSMDPAMAMIGPAYDALLAMMEGITSVQADSSRMQRHLKSILEKSKSATVVCSVFPIIRHLLPTSTQAALPLDLTKARGDVHKVSRAVDMGEMIQLSMKLEAYLARRVPRDGEK